MATQNFRVKNGIEVGTGVTISSTSGLFGNVVGDINSSGVSTFTTLKVGSNVTINSGIVTAHGASIDNVRIGIDNDNTIDTSSGSLILDSNGGTVIINDQLSVSGVATFQSDVKLGDNDTLYFGDGDDLKIFHNGSHSIIQDTGTGNLYILASNQLALQSSTSENYLIGNSNGSVELYYDNIKEFETTGYGATVFGTLQSQQLNVTGVSTFAGITTVTGPTLFSKQLNVSGVSTFAGITNVTGSTLFANQLSVSGVSTITTLEGTTLKNYGETINNIGNTGTAATINLANGNFVTATLTDNCTFTFTTGLSSGAISFTLLLTNDATPGRSIVWPPTVKWPGSSVPTRTTSANATDIYTFFTLNNGTNWYGSLSLYNYA